MASRLSSNSVPEAKKSIFQNAKLLLGGRICICLFLRLFFFLFISFVSKATLMPNNRHLTPQGQISFLQNWPVGGLHWAQGIPIATFCPNKLCMLQQEHLHLIIFTLIILLPPINTHRQTHFNLWSSTGSNRGSGWSRALGSLSVFSFVQDSGPLTRLFLYFLFISYLFFPTLSSRYQLLN